MFGKDFWRIMKFIYIIIRALLQADSNGTSMPDPPNDE